jgi:hypothetical protein
MRLVAVGAVLLLSVGAVACASTKEIVPAGSLPLGFPPRFAGPRAP